jgi:hypothetical protein
MVKYLDNIDSFPNLVDQDPHEKGVIRGDNHRPDSLQNTGVFVQEIES